MQDKKPNLHHIIKIGSISFKSVMYILYFAAYFPINPPEDNIVNYAK